MNILITGSSGFLGSNLVDRLKKLGSYKLYCVNSKTDQSQIEEFTKDCDFFFDFAASHRPKDSSEFEEINCHYLTNILNMLERNNNCCPVLYTSSIQSGNGTEYGSSKLKAELIAREYAHRNNTKAYIYRLTNTFGKWARPNGHSVVATFCYNINRGIPIRIDQPDRIMELYYVDDVIDDFITRLSCEGGAYDAPIIRLDEKHLYRISLRELADVFYRFKNGYKPENDELEIRLFKTYNAYAVSETEG